MNDVREATLPIVMNGKRELKSSLQITDAILAALPEIIADMVPDLEWKASTYSKKFMSDIYVVQHEYDSAGNGCWAFGTGDKWISDHETLEYANEAANAHNRATILKALGMKEQGND